MKPNVVVILTDQQQAQALGYVNSSYLTPNLDALAAKGVSFSHYYSCSAQCTPSRAAMMTGHYPHEVGVYQIGHALSPRYSTVGKTFLNAGYRTAYFGKWHLFSPETEHGFMIVDYKNNGVAHGSIDPNENTQQGMDARTTAKALNFLSEVSSDRPFFLVISWYAPHPPFRDIAPYSDHFLSDRMAVPQSFYDDDLSTKPSWQAVRASQGESLLTEELVRADARAYRSQVAYMDWNVGRVLDTVQRRGLAKNTVIVFTSDHGDMQGSHRLRYKGVLPYEELYRIPLIIYAPDWVPPRKIVPDMASNVSLSATLLELAQLSVPASFHGPSLVPKILADKSEGDQTVFIEHWRAYWGYHPFRGIVTPEWKYVYYFKDDVEEMYDRKHDPDEITNEARNPRYVQLKSVLRSRVDEWWERTGGTRTQPIKVQTGWIDTEH